MKNISKKIVLAMAAVGCAASLCYADSIAYVKKDGGCVRAYNSNNSIIAQRCGDWEVVGFTSSTFTIRTCSYVDKCAGGKGWSYEVRDSEGSLIKNWSE